MLWGGGGRNEYKWLHLCRSRKLIPRPLHAIHTHITKSMRVTDLIPDPPSCDVQDLIFFTFLAKVIMFSKHVLSCEVNFFWISQLETELSKWLLAKDQCQHILVNFLSWELQILEFVKKISARASHANQGLPQPLVSMHLHHCLSPSVQLQSSQTVAETNGCVSFYVYSMNSRLIRRTTVISRASSFIRRWFQNWSVGQQSFRKHHHS